MKVKNDYLALLLSDCQIDKFLKLIAEQGGVANDSWWDKTPEGQKPVFGLKNQMSY